MNAPLGDAPQSLTGLHVIDATGAKVGTVQQVYRDDATNEPEWITVRTGLFGMKETFIPLAGARRTGDELHVPHAKDTIKDAPRIDADGHLDPSEEAELYRHYGLDRPGMSNPGELGELESPGGAASRADTVVSSGPRPDTTGDPSGAAGATGIRHRASQDTAQHARPTADTAHHPPAGGERNKLFDRPMAMSRGRDELDTVNGKEQAPEMVLSEEQMEIGTEERESGRAHVRKHVVTEEVHRTVPLTHEEVRVVREKITEEERRTGRTTHRLGEGEVEIVLHEEQAVISKKTVPVERVRLETEWVTEQQEVSAEIRREELEIDDGRGGGRKESGPDRPR
ncbi:PRC and DUF2382 domain-containing protein [Streptomyces inhibens]|uniref:PRC and DUF2382 domain-containing protein n=1 Tax=Streptomyces inhibens TaxID=2293571 RepID=UPI001EE71613|nr:PRC and DUF2382 domain-containing protein [Streptomyces inhibens]UKY52855.1 PRC and DUF2382 domain-containing protein [Streptomyces inhibens]